MKAKRRKIVTAKHTNCDNRYTFHVPDSMDLNVGDFILVKTSNHLLPQVAKCITPSFSILEEQLIELYSIQPGSMSPVVGILKPVMYAFEDGAEE